MAPLSMLETVSDSYLLSRPFLFATTIVASLMCSLSLIVAILMCCRGKKENPQSEPSKKLNVSYEDDYDQPYYESAKSVTMESIHHQQQQQLDQRSMSPSQVDSIKLQPYIAENQEARATASFANDPGAYEGRQEEKSEKVPSIRLMSCGERYPIPTKSPQDQSPLPAAVQVQSPPKQISKLPKEPFSITASSTANTSSFETLSELSQNSPYMNHSYSQDFSAQPSESSAPAVKTSSGRHRVSIHPHISSFKETSSMRDRLDASTITANDSTFQNNKSYSAKDWSTKPRILKRPESPPQERILDPTTQLQQPTNVAVQFQDGHNFEH